jgi:signal transduction histidine kinase
MTARQRSIAMMVLIGGIGLILSILAYIAARDSDNERVREVIAFRTDWRASDLEHKLQPLATPAAALASFVALQGTITATEFDRFPLSQLEGLSVYRSLIWAPRVAGDDRAVFEKKMQEAGDPGFAIRELNQARDPIPAPIRDEYFPVVFGRAFDPAPVPRGFDTIGPPRDVAARAARDSGRPMIGPPVAVSSEQDLRSTIFVPVYRNTQIPPTEAARRDALIGYVVGVLRLIPALDAATADTPAIVEDIYLGIRDQSGAFTPYVKYDNATSHFSAYRGVIDLATLDGEVVLQPVEFLGATWTAASHFKPQALESLRSPGQWLWPVAGMLLTTLILLALGRARRDVVLAELRTEEAERQAAERFRELTADMAHISRLSAMGQLSSSLAHELNQPLTAVMNYAEAARQMLSGSDVPPRVPEFLEKTIGQAERAGQIIRRLRGHVEKRSVERTAESLNQVIEEASALALVGATVDEIDVVFELAPDLPPVSIDKIQIQQVIVNLVRNAVEVLRTTRHRVLTIRTRLADDGAQEVSVTDTGPGLAPEVAGQLFQPFVTTKKEGMGIGLSISRSIVETHEGRLWHEPNPEGGAVFRFTLQPAASVEHA